MQLRIPYTDIREAGLRVDGPLNVAAMRPEGAAELPVTEASLSGTLTAMGEEVLFRGWLRGEFEQPCDRCLEPVALPFDIECVWYFEPDTGEAPELEDDEVRRMDGDIVDLGRYAWEEMALAVPVKFVHPDDQPCAFRDTYHEQANDGADAAAANPFSKLKEMFPDLTENENKE